jgi:Protein of unknown function (DUF1553)/Protein of unknown function (DUF1549)/Concanavalin A-like lectin/glucanases superfamily/Planctomycete cytochrome C
MSLESPMFDPKSLKQLQVNSSPSFASQLCSFLLGLSLCCCLFQFNPLLAQNLNSDSQIDFSSQIRPILAVHCYSCHGPDEHSRAAELRLDIREQALASSAFVPHDTSKSKLVERIMSHDEEYQMPPPDSKKPLTQKQKELLTQWIEQGAGYSNHWAFTTPIPIRVTPTTQWGNNEIDAFVGKRLEQEKLKPSPKADRATLLRRVSLDLTGLPPTVDELKQFMEDSSEGAYERAVDRLLDSKQYAERMALEWLDLARYADTNGYNNDEDRTMWPWRDWVINAFDRNMPFDQFTMEQLAGDLLSNPTQDQLIATGFLRNQGHNTEGGIIQEEYRVEYVADRVHTVSTVFLGLSMQCARCHDHKFDPISQKEYYQFYSFFNSLDEKQAGYSKFVGADPFIRVPTADQSSKVKTLDEQIASLKSLSKQLEDQADASVAKLVAETSESDLRTRFAQTALFRFPLDRTESGTVFDAITETSIGKTSGTLAWQEGKKQDAIELVEGSRIELGEIAQFSHERPFSISVWVKPNSNEGMAIVSKMDESASFRGYDLLLSGGKIEMHIVHHWPDNAIKVSTKKATTPNEWHHIVVTYDGSKTAAGARVYVDSKLEPHDVVQDSLRDPIDTQQPFRIGLRQQTLPYRGLIDELQLFGSVLDEANVKQLAAFEPVTGFSDWVRVPAADRTEAHRKQIQQFYLDRIDTEYSGVQKKISEATKEKAALEDTYPAVMVLREMNPPRETFVLKRGQYDQPADKVASNVPAVLLKPDLQNPPDRLTLARWIASDSNPLTARVTVNRWWQNYFGTGIVKTVEDFGLTGDAPSHPELLDYLACTFVESGWNVKAMQKLIVMSATYQQESRITPEMLERDPENRLLARGPRHRLSAETIRDNALRISGLLQPRIGGPSVKPYQPSGLWEDVTVERRGKYVADVGEGLYRRSLYTFWKRTCPPPSMMSFDAPNREVCLARRARTNTPLQSLVLLNDPTYVECARLLAQIMIREGAASASERIDAGMKRAVARSATEAEKKLLTEVLEAAKQKFSSNSANAQSLIATGATPPDSSIDPAELAAWTIVASTLLNLDETISKR